MDFTLPGTFEAGKTYIVKGATAVAWQKALKADRVIAGSGIRESETTGGRIFSTSASGVNLDLLIAGADVTGTLAGGEPGPDSSTSFLLKFRNGRLTEASFSTGFEGSSGDDSPMQVTINVSPEP